MVCNVSVETLKIVEEHCPEGLQRAQGPSEVMSIPVLLEVHRFNITKT
ncbi:2377_t:CDS:1, partial [Racocetra persica]